jgi:hypothetical protein
MAPGSHCGSSLLEHIFPRCISQWWTNTLIAGDEAQIRRAFLNTRVSLNPAQWVISAADDHHLKQDDIFEVKGTFYALLNKNFR